jgi:Fuc2NAc and GlcNAc transferase
MDGINGIAGITGFVGFGLLGWFAIDESADSQVSILSFCMSMACLGFLPFNIPHARVFMGDVGSILLGFVYAGIAVWLSNSLLDFICVAAFIFPFYADEFTTLFLRIKEGERLSRPHRKHLYQILANEKKITHWKISFAYGVLQLAVGFSIMLMKDFGIFMVVSVLSVCFGAFILFNYFLRRNLARTS